MQTSISTINRSVEKTNQWLEELTEEGRFENKEEAYAVLKAVLHAFRDRLLIDQAVHFAAQLPLLIQGVYYEGWDPSAVPIKDRNQAEFLNHIAHELKAYADKVGPEEAVQVVFHVLTRKISSGSIQKAIEQLPKDIGELINDTYQ